MARRRPKGTYPKPVAVTRPPTEAERNMGIGDFQIPHDPDRLTGELQTQPKSSISELRVEMLELKSALVATRVGQGKAVAVVDASIQTFLNTVQEEILRETQASSAKETETLRIVFRCERSVAELVTGLKGLRLALEQCNRSAEELHDRVRHHEREAVKRYQQLAGLVAGAVILLGVLVISIA